MSIWRSFTYILFSIRLLLLNVIFVLCVVVVEVLSQNLEVPTDSRLCFAIYFVIWILDDKCLGSRRNQVNIYVCIFKLCTGFLLFRSFVPHYHTHWAFFLLLFQIKSIDTRTFALRKKQLWMLRSIMWWIIPFLSASFEFGRIFFSLFKNNLNGEEKNALKTI